MIFDMGKNTHWNPVIFTADDLETQEGYWKMQLMLHRAQVAVATESMERILKMVEMTE